MKNNKILNYNLYKNFLYKFFFLNFNDLPKILNINLFLKNIEKINLYLYFYFIEQLFYKKSQFNLGKSKYTKTGLKIKDMNLCLKLVDKNYIINFLKIIFITLKNVSVKKNIIININLNNVYINYLLTDFLINLYNDFLTNILLKINLNFTFNIKNHFLIYYFFRLINII